MGTDVIVKGNHRIIFEGRDLSAVAEEIVNKLNDIEIEEDEFSVLGGANIPIPLFSHSSEYVEGNISENTEAYLSISGVIDLNVDKYLCEFIVAIRYRTWCLAEEEGRNEWRKIWRKLFQKIIVVLGGDSLMYLADNAHELERYDYSARLHDVETDLFTNLGNPAESFEEAYNNAHTGYGGRYMLERFERGSQNA